MAFLSINNCSDFLRFFLICLLSHNIPLAYSLSTVSISEDNNNNQILVCALIINPSNSTHQNPNPNFSLNCTGFPSGIQFPFNPINHSFSEIVSGNGFLCGLMNTPPTSSVLTCWRFSAINVSNLQYKRIYRGPPIQELDAGNSNFCGLNGSNHIKCWQWREFKAPTNQTFEKIAVGDKFVCGISEKTRNVSCFGSNNGVVGHEPIGSYREIAGGFSHACALSMDNRLHCWGDYDNMSQPTQQEELASITLGENRSCALRPNGTAVCWGQNDFVLPESLRETRFLAIEAKRTVFCGVLSSNLSLYCWGNEILDSNSAVFDNVSPGLCTNKCPGRLLLDSETICGQGLFLCDPSWRETSPSVPEPLSPSPEPAKSCGSGWTKKMVAFMVVGCVGSLSLALVICFFLFRYCKVKGCRVHDSGRLDEAGTQADDGSSRCRSGPHDQDNHSGPVLEKRLSHLISLGNNGTHLEEFSLEVLIEATNNFSEDRRIGTGSFGSVYHGELNDGREVAIKRAEASTSSSFGGGGLFMKRQEDKDNAFLRELEFLSRLNHKNLVRLLGFYDDDKERVLVYEYIANGSLHDHLHKAEVEPSSPLVTWWGRIQVALDAARGIQYLHEFAVPPIIHRDIKTSNILLDDTWSAKVSDFGLSLMGPEDDVSHLSLRAAGTMGYIDPEYFRLQKLTTKSDVYSFGVLLLELLSGHKAIHKNENGVPRNVVDYMVPRIVTDEIHRVLDPKVPPPTPYEIEAVAYVGYIAADCVKLEGRDRPSMSVVVSSLETALAACFARPQLSRSTTDSST